MNQPIRGAIAAITHHSRYRFAPTVVMPMAGGLLCFRKPRDIDDDGPGWPKTQGAGWC